MWLRSFLLCEDVRFERTGQMTLVGVHGERIVLPAGDDPTRPVVLERGVVVAVLAGLVGQERISWRLDLLSEGATMPANEPVRTVDAHDPRRREHTLVSLHAPLSFGAPGHHRFVLEASVPGESHTFTLPIEVVRTATA